MKYKTQNQPKPIVRTRYCTFAYGSSSNNLPCFSPDSRQSHNALY